MKLNLPSTLTDQKAWFFYLWILANLKISKSGKTFENCLNDPFSLGNYTDLVNKIANASSPTTGTFCCGYLLPSSLNLNEPNVNCSPLIADQNYNFTNYCPENTRGPSFGRCTKLNSSYFCVTYDSAFKSSAEFKLGNQVLCGGRLGDNLITTNLTVDKYSDLSLDELTQFLIGINSNFTAVCCYSNTITTTDGCYQGDMKQAKYGRVSSTATNCDYYNLMCFQDNGAWTCTGSINAQINFYPLGYIANGTYPNIYDYPDYPTSVSDITYIGDVNIQLKLPINSSSSTTTISPSTSFITIPSSSSNSSTNNLTLIIPTTIGTLFGVSSVSGLTYYLYKKRKKAQTNQERDQEENELSNLNETEFLSKKNNESLRVLNSDPLLENTLDWKNIDPNFTSQLQNEWERQGFNYQQTKEWIDIGLTINDAKFCSWLRGNKKLDSITVLSDSDINIEDLREEYEKSIEELGETENLIKKIENKEWEIETNKTSHSKNTGNQTLIADFIGKIEKINEENDDLQIQLINAHERLTKFTESQTVISKQIVEKRNELANLKNNCFKKRGNYDQEELNKEIEELLEAQVNNNNKWKERIKKDLVERTSLIDTDLDNLCQTREELFVLEKQLGRTEANIRETEERIIIINNNITYQVADGGFLNTGQIEIAGESNSVNLGGIQNQESQAQIIQQPSKPN